MRVIIAFFFVSLFVSCTVGVFIYAQMGSNPETRNTLGMASGLFFRSEIDKQIESGINELSEEAQKIALLQLVHLMFIPDDEFLLQGKNATNKDVAVDLGKAIDAYRSGMFSGWSLAIKRFIENEQEFFDGKWLDYDGYREKIRASVMNFSGGGESMRMDEHGYMLRFGKIPTREAPSGGISPEVSVGYSEGKTLARALIAGASQKIIREASSTHQRIDSGLPDEAKKTDLADAIKKIPEVEAIMFLKEIIRLKEKRDTLRVSEARK